jgi:hypothetical protein
MVDMSRIGQNLVAALGALLLSATAVGAAVGPATPGLAAAPISSQAGA